MPRFTFHSTPPGASVLQAGRLLGTTPLEVARPEASAGPWRFQLEGHVPLEVEHLPEGSRLDVALKRLPPSRVRTPAPAPVQKVQDLKPNPF